MSDKDCEHVYELVYSSHRAVAQAAGEFLNERLFQPTDMDPGKTKRGKRRLPNTPFIRDLVQFFIESEVSQLVFNVNKLFIKLNLFSYMNMVHIWSILSSNQTQ